MNSSPILLKAENIHQTYSKNSASIEVLKGLNLEMRVGDQAVLLGASGTGKSTLLRILGALETPSAGEVFFEGKSLSGQSDSELSLFRNRTLGFVFQFHHLLPLFTSVENVMMPALIGGMSRTEAAKKALDLLKKVGLNARGSHYPQQLSGGEQQRVAIARSLVCDPKLLLADEPTGNLDTENSKRVFDLLLNLSQTFQTTLLVVTHNEDLATRFSRPIRMQNGQLVEKNAV